MREIWWEGDERGGMCQKWMAETVVMDMADSCEVLIEGVGTCCLGSTTKSHHVLVLLS